MIISIIHLFFISFATYVILRFLMRPIGDKLGTVNDSLKLGAILFLYWISIIEFYFKQQIQRKFWRIAQNIDRQFCSRSLLSFKLYILKITIFLLLCIVLFQNYFVRLITLNRRGLYFFWFCYMCVSLYRGNLIFYYLFYLEFINKQLKMICYEIREISCACKNGHLQNDKFFLKNFHRNRFKWFRKFYSSVYDLCDIVNSVFSLLSTLAVIFSFLLLLADFNWLYWKLFNKSSIDKLGNAIQTILLYLLILICLIFMTLSRIYVMVRTELNSLFCFSDSIILH